MTSCDQLYHSFHHGFRCLAPCHELEWLVLQRYKVWSLKGCTANTNTFLVCTSLHKTATRDDPCSQGLMHTNDWCSRPLAHPFVAFCWWASSCWRCDVCWRSGWEIISPFVPNYQLTLVLGLCTSRMRCLEVSKQIMSWGNRHLYQRYCMSRWSEWCVV